MIFALVFMTETLREFVDVDVFLVERLSLNVK